MTFARANEISKLFVRVLGGGIVSSGKCRSRPRTRNLVAIEAAKLKLGLALNDVAGGGK